MAPHLCRIGSRNIYLLAAARHFETQGKEDGHKGIASPPLLHIRHEWHKPAAANIHIFAAQEPVAATQGPLT